MEAKLIKHGHSYALLKDGKMVAFAHPEDFSNDHTIGKLSLKNCQAIERGYDLDELALEAFELDLNCQGDCNNYYERLAYKLGMIKMIGLLGDKKFSEEKMKLFAEYVWKEVRSGRMKSMDELFNDWTSPQQTEWDCIVEMEYYDPLPPTRQTALRPKLDADGCLILKRK